MPFLFGRICLHGIERVRHVLHLVSDVLFEFNQSLVVGSENVSDVIFILVSDDRPFVDL